MAGTKTQILKGKVGKLEAVQDYKGYDAVAGKGKYEEYTKATVYVSFDDGKSAGVIDLRTNGELQIGDEFEVAVTRAIPEAALAAVA